MHIPLGGGEAAGESTRATHWMLVVVGKEDLQNSKLLVINLEVRLANGIKTLQLCL